MNGDPFGNLRDWSDALAEVRRRVASGTIDEAQDGLVRLIRYRHNWQLREQALQAAREVMTPETSLVRAVLCVAVDVDAYPEVRLLAVRALGELVPRRRSQPVPAGVESDVVVSTLKRLLEVPEYPVLHGAFEQAIHRIESQTSPVLA